jgi:hypothetical protein
MNNGLIGFAMTTDGTQDMFTDAAGNLGIVSGPDCMSDNIETNCKLWATEYAYDTNIGITYGVIIGNPHADITLINTQYNNAILLSNNYLTISQYNAFGINAITSLTFNVDNTTRLMNLDATVLLNNNTALQIELEI